MRITLLAVGRKMPSWVNAGYTEYARRMTGECRLELRELPQQRAGNPDVVREREGRKMLAVMPAGTHIVALEVNGDLWNTQELAKQLQRWKALGRDVCLLIGGPEGLSSACLDTAAQRWSLSALTLPHPLVRIVVAEQLYRAETMLRGHPYHRA